MRPDVLPLIIRNQMITEMYRYTATLLVGFIMSTSSCQNCTESQLAKEPLRKCKHFHS